MKLNTNSYSTKDPNVFYKLNKITYFIYSVNW